MIATLPELPLSRRRAGMAGNRSRTRRLRRIADAGAARRVRRRAPQLTLSELARAADLSLSTTHRLAAELVAWGALARLTTAGTCSGGGCGTSGCWLRCIAGLRELAVALPARLYAATLATVHLAERDGTERCTWSASRVVPRCRWSASVGARLPMHATAVGKVLLAYAPADVRTDVLGDLTRITAYTIIAAGPLLRAATPGSRARVRAHGRGDEAGRVLGRGAGPGRRASSSRRSASSCPSLKRDRPRLVAALQVAARASGAALADAAFTE